jgi:hypothetical protein
VRNGHPGIGVRGRLGIQGPGSSAGTGNGGGGGGGGGYVADGDGGGGPEPTAVPPPTQFSDLAYEVKEMSGYYASGWVVDKLITFNVSDACMKRMVTDTAGAVPSVRDIVFDIQLYAKAITKDDWLEIEHQDTNIERNKQYVEPMIDELAKVFHLTINLEGDDYDTTRGSLWQRTYIAAMSALLAYPPATGRAFVTVNISPKLRTVAAKAEADGSTFTIDGPRDIDSGVLNEPIEKMFKRVSSPR